MYSSLPTRKCALHLLQVKKFFCSSFLWMISPQASHFVQRPSGISFFWVSAAMFSLERRNQDMEGASS